MIEIIAQNTEIDVGAMAEFEREAMCRTICGSIRRLFEDERNRTDFEQWKKNRYKAKGA